MWAGLTRGFGEIHFGVQAVVGPMRFICLHGLLAALRRIYVVHLSRACDSILPARSDVVPHIRGLSRLQEVAGWSAQELWSLGSCAS
jgi:hypothetical protein